jgi:hypothetical protein
LTSLFIDLSFLILFMFVCFLFFGSSLTIRLLFSNQILIAFLSDDDSVLPTDLFTNNVCMKSPLLICLLLVCLWFMVVNSLF